MFAFPSILSHSTSTLKDIFHEMETKAAIHPIYHKHFAKLHERIQNKYEEMQQKLEKSRSIDTLTSLNLQDDYGYEEKKCVSVSDLSNVLDFTISENRRKSNLQTVVFQDKHKDATSQDIIVNEAVITEPDLLLNINEKLESENEDTVDNQFFGNNDFKTSLESLNETKESDESSEPYTPTTKSIRSKIKFKLKNRQKEKEKFKKREPRDKVEKSDTKKKTKEEKTNEYSCMNLNLEFLTIKYILSNTTKYSIIKTIKKTKIAIVTLALIEVKGFEETDDEKSRVLLFRFRLGAEKRKSKIVKCDSARVKFQELINFNLYEDEDDLEITLWDKDTVIGRTQIDLAQMEKEKTHKMFINLEGELKNLQIFILLTISGTTSMNTVYDDNEYIRRKREYLLNKKYAWYHLYDKFSNVGFLQIIAYGAKGLSGQDCFCIFKLDYQRLQTQTDYKTNEPSWMKIFSFTVTDITSILEVIVFDEKKCEEVGRISKPLLTIQPGKKWYALKDFSLKDKARGNNPRILLEMNIAWNFIKGAVRVINPKESSYTEIDEKLDRHVFTRNLSRAKTITTWIISTYKIYKTCFEWESAKVNVVSLIIWLTFCFYVQMWMIPLLLLIPFFWYKPKEYTLIDWKKQLMHEIAPENDADLKNEKEDKPQSLRQKLNSLQEILQSIQKIIGKLANTGERIKNLFNFTVPFVSFLAIFFIVLIAFVMYLIPFNYICMIWGVNKFMKKILRPNRIRNNEMMDLLSRVPDDETLVECDELPLGEISDDNDK